MLYSRYQVKKKIYFITNIRLLAFYIALCESNMCSKQIRAVKIDNVLVFNLYCLSSTYEKSLITTLYWDQE